METIVIIGAGHAAGQVVATLRQKKFAGHITLLGDEAWYPYQRPPLSKKYLAGELPADRLYVKPPSFYADLNVDVQLETEVTSIDPASRTVQCVSGQSFHYDKLIIATGSRPRKIALPGSDLPGVHYLRNIDDVNAIRASLTTNSRVAIIGAGYIGLEVAAVAAQLGHSVTVVEMADRVMSRVVSKEVSHFYQEIHSAHGVALELSASIDRLTGTNRVDGVALASGQQLPADIVIVGIGIVPNIELAKEAGLEVGNGIVVDNRCRTSDENIYAVGDCTWHPNAVLGFDLRLESVHNALEQAKTAATNICGEELTYSQVPWFWSDQFDLKLQIAGLSAGYDQTVIRGDIAGSKFSCLYLSEGRLIAIDAINRPKDFIQAKALIAARVVVDPKRLEDVQIELKDMAN
jgi:3-phenylpropionate/trans-cinnamate dioxygenase ferredoxin reductase subunit